MQCDFSLTPIAIARTDFKQKFAIPRQSGLVENLASIEMLPPYNRIECLEGLEDFSHLWLIFGFHKSIQNKSTYKTQIKPPKYPENKKVGVFATRSPHRPNNLGLSLVKLIKIYSNAKRIFLLIESADILDATPIFDIKPYLPKLEAKGDAKFYASPNSDLLYEVEFSATCKEFLAREKSDYLQKIIAQTLALDPRPRNQLKNFAKVYCANIANIEIKFMFKKSATNNTYIEVTALSSNKLD